MADYLIVLMDSVRECFPDECEIIGTDDFDKLAQRLTIVRSTGQNELLQEIRGGHSNEVAGIIEIVAAAIALTRELVELYVTLKRELGRSPYVKELLRASIGRTPAQHPQVMSKREELATIVVNKLDASISA